MKITFLLLCFLIPFVKAQLRVGFYGSTCPRAEKIVRQVVQQQFSTDRSTTAALLRLHFHDCFVGGCDASLLIDSTPQNPSEKNTGANLSVRGFELIDKIKSKLEAACPDTVSCADVIALATRDSVALAGGPRYTLATGRRDGLVSDPNNVDLPGPGISVPGFLKFFGNKGFNATEAVTLMGAHTIGVANCNAFVNTQGFRGKICSGNSQSAFLDQNTSFIVDNEFYNQIQKGRGVMQIDQALALDSTTAPIVSDFAKNAIKFQRSFGKAMAKLASFNVNVGNKGEIRKNCRAFN